MGFLSSKVSVSLQKAFEEINENIYNVNRGGCGFFVKHLYDCLLNIGFNPELVVLVSERSIDSANESINNNSVSHLFNTNWYHIMVKLSEGDKVIYIDSNGYFDDLVDHPTFYYCHAIDLPHDTLTTMLDDEYRNRWNSQFNRKDSTKIKKKLEKHLVGRKKIAIFGLSI